MTEKITKIEAAQRQLITAIELFLRGGEPVSVYSLATNAWEVIDALCTKEGIDSLSDETRENITTGSELKKDLINSPYRNFFKHADRDPDSVLEGFSDLENDHIIFLSVEDYIRLNKKSPVELQVYQLWYLSINIDKVAHEALADILAATEVMFPSIKEQNRERQKSMALQAITDAYGDRELNDSPEVEKAYHRLFEPSA
ncbi:hypothetical protein [Dasania marina]|uniref:hypothetical protein n=1 Tax=Dasania marina TaxID=471499 RepID=UPI000361A99B|nr:hypothetical protein [Dasania marina]